MAKKRKSYTEEFKAEAVRLVHQRHLTFSQVGRDLGVEKSIIRGWVRRAEMEEMAENPVEATSAAALRDEIRQLRKENDILREEREILKKAAAFFAKETL